MTLTWVSSDIHQRIGADVVRSTLPVSGHDQGHMRLKRWPLLNADNYDCNGPTGQVLLMLQVLVRREEDLETGVLGGGQKDAVLPSVPLV